MLLVGTVTFIVGPEKRLLEHTVKSVLCVRSEYFNRMFRSEIGRSDEVPVLETSFEAVESLIQYLLTDQLVVDTSTQHAFDTLDLARRYQLARLEALCQQQIEEALTEHNVLPLMEASHRLNHDRLVFKCRQYESKNTASVLASGSAAQLDSLQVTRGLLLDAMKKVAHYEAEKHGSIETGIGDS